MVVLVAVLIRKYLQPQIFDEEESQHVKTHY
jgi:hypothetical protein